jgi:hypothetical protein
MQFTQPCDARLGLRRQFDPTGVHCHLVLRQAVNILQPDPVGRPQAGRKVVKRRDLAGGRPRKTRRKQTAALEGTGWGIGARFYITLRLG